MSKAESALPTVQWTQVDIDLSNADLKAESALSMVQVDSSGY